MGSIKAINVMYLQQLVHLPKTIKRKTLDSVMKTLTEKLNPLKIAGIIHDKDIDENGDHIEKHVHIILQFTNQRSLSNLAKLIEEPQVASFQQWRGNINNAYSYLVHQTNDAQNKHQYSIEEVKANFDYPKLITDITKKVHINSGLKDNEVIKNGLDQLRNREIFVEELTSILTGSQFAKAKRQIKDINQLVQEEDAKIWLENRKLMNEPVEVIWIYGSAGTGKTVMAKKYAKFNNEKYFITGSSKDCFQEYSGEHTVILDELRPTTFQYDDLLKLLDPFGESPKAPSRYFDKSLMVSLFIVTSPYSPRQFYDEIFVQKNMVDSFEQLNRRITFVQYMTHTYYEMQEFDENAQEYKSVESTKKENNLIQNLKKQKVIDGRETYNKFNQSKNEMGD